MPGTVRISGRTDIDRDLTDIFTIKDEITHTIVEQLKVRLLPQEKQAIQDAPTQNMEAYNYYLKGRHFYHLLTTPHARLAQRMFKKAIGLDPAYARAYAGLADCAWHLHMLPHAETTVEEILEASTKAVELDPTLAEAHASLGLAHHYSGRHENAVAEFERAIALNPNLFEAYYNYSTALRDAGDRQAAAEMLARAAEIAPDDFRTPLGLSHMYHDLKRGPQAREAARIGIERAERALAVHPDIALPAALCAVALARLDERAPAIEWISRALTIAPDDPLTQYNVACAYSLLGEPDQAIDMLEPWGAMANAATRSWVVHDTDLDNVRDNPRFQKLFEPVR